MSKSRRNFIPVPLAAQASDASAEQKAYIAAHYHFDWDGEKTWPSQATLAAIMGVSLRTVGRCQKYWEDKGWITVQRVPNQQSTYFLNVPDMSLDEFNKIIKAKAALIGSDSLTEPTTIRIGLSDRTGSDSLTDKQELTEPELSSPPEPLNPIPTVSLPTPEEEEEIPKAGSVTPLQSVRIEVDGFDDNVPSSEFFKAWNAAQLKAYRKPYLYISHKDLKPFKRLKNSGFTLLEHLDILENYFSTDPKVGWLFNQSSQRIDLEMYESTYRRYEPTERLEEDKPTTGMMKQFKELQAAAIARSQEAENAV